MEAVWAAHAWWTSQVLVLLVLDKTSICNFLSYSNYCLYRSLLCSRCSALLLSSYCLSTIQWGSRWKLYGRRMHDGPRRYLSCSYLIRLLCVIFSHILTIACIDLCYVLAVALFSWPLTAWVQYNEGLDGSCMGGACMVDLAGTCLARTW